MTLFFDTFSTPLGEFSVAVDADGAVVATAFGDLAALQKRLRNVPLRKMVGRGVPAEPLTSAAHRDGSPHPVLARDVGAPRVSAGRKYLASRAARHDFDRGIDRGADPRLTAAVRDQVGEYFAGRRQAFDLPLAPAGSGFQQRVWAALGTIPFGETRSYGQLARTLGCPDGARAVGGANAANPICLLVPCHRVIGSDGSLTGFAFGETRKRALLEHERAVLRATSHVPAVSRAACPC